ncbi:MAG: response regulator [Deltaproteobacteria bacterium]|nr:response regulator [Deltaproteobacteria bacterium]
MKLKHARILIVEDSLTQALLLQDLLEENHYSVDVADDGERALSRLEDLHPDLVISDIIMPKMDGYELCRAIKADEKLKDIPVFLLTTLSEPDDIIKGLSCGASHFVTKPYDEASLVSSIQYILVNRDIRHRVQSEMGIEIFFSGQHHFINSDRIQILDLLFSSYENALRQKQKLEKTNKKLLKALDTIQTLKGFIPICSNCKKIRDDKGYWNSLETYIQEHSDAKFSHGICPDCTKKLYPELSDDLEEEK